MRLKEENEILAAALSLAPESRAAVAEKLIESLDAPDQVEIDRLWAQEVEDRLQAFEDGELHPIPGDEVFESLQARLKR